MSSQPREAASARSPSHADGRPHVTPVWVVLDGEGKSLLRDQRIAVCVNDETYPYTFVLIEGEASISRDHDEHRRLAIAIGERHTGSDEAEAFAEYSLAGQGVVRARITKVTAHRAVAKP